MLETIVTIIMVGVGVVLGLVILAYATYITFFPLVRTLGGGVQVLKAYGHGQKKVKATKEGYGLIPDAQLGLTMADGGDEVKEQKGPEGK